MTKNTHSEIVAPAWLSIALLVIRRARVHELAVLTGRQNFALPRRDGAIRQGYFPPSVAGQAEATSRSASLRTDAFPEGKRKLTKLLVG